MRKEIKNSVKKSIVIQKTIIDSIYSIRSMQIMIDEELAQMYDVTVKRLNKQVKRNIDRFPEKLKSQ